jgi:hypothetical protein
LDLFVDTSLGFDPNRSLSDSYISVPSYASQALVSSVNMPVYQNVPIITTMEYIGQSRVAYDDQAGPYLNVGSTPIPQITSWQPMRGSKGTQMEIYISSLYDLAMSTVPTFFLMFASQKCHASLTKLDQQGGVCQYVVTAVVPAHSSTRWESLQVPVHLLMESGEGELIGKVDVGKFQYVEGRSQDASNFSDAPRKRRLSEDTLEVTKIPAKRSSSNQLRPKEDFLSYDFPESSDTQFSPYLQSGTQYSTVPQYDRNTGSYQQPSQRAAYQYHYSTSSANSPPDIKAYSPQVSARSPYSTVSSHAPSPALGPATTMSRPSLSGLPSPLTVNPPLVRTTMLQQTPSPGTTPAGAQQSGQAFNPYSLYPRKAVLNLVGDLDSMTENWTEDEWEKGRRLVMFKRSRTDCTITATFSPVSLEERPPNSICISCIYWKGKNECFVTSVDMISLLESLIAIRFTVEEKNRIRRNVQGFRPITVSKAKPESEDLFRLIMGFPIPKPRNIEKDVKVFPWKILNHALKKIVGKYVSTILLMNVFS